MFPFQLLTRLLKSNHPEDLQAANRLIKNLVKEVGIFQGVLQNQHLTGAGQCREIPWKRAWEPTPIFLPGESHGQEPGGLQSMGLQRVGHD